MTICKRSCIVLQCSAHVLRCSAHFCRNFADLLKFTKLSEVSCTQAEVEADLAFFQQA